MKIIALTGSIGSGKSTVARLFEKRGIPVINLDRLGHRLLEGMAIRQKLIRMFGPSVCVRREIKRPVLRKMVFSAPERLACFNRLVHPPLIRLLESEIVKYRKQKRPFLVLDAALLFEMKIDRMADFIVTIRTGKLVSWLRTLRTRKMGYGEYCRIRRSQLPAGEKAKRSDYVIRNNLPFCLSKVFLEKKVGDILDEMG